MTPRPRRSLLLAAVALLAPVAALAHHGERHAPPEALAQAVPPAPPPPRPDPALREMQRERANPGVPPGVQAQRRAAEEADEADLAGALDNLRAARRALDARRFGEANELVERAEARLLTRSTLAQRAGDPVTGGAVGRLAEARAALLRRDYAAARAAVDEVVAAGERARGRAAPAPR